LILGAVLALAVSACGWGDRSASPSSGSTAAGRITVFAAASLTEPFTDAKTALAASAPGLDIALNFAGSGALVTQIEEGAPADVVATADNASMQELVDQGLVETPVALARNRLEILVAPGNPKKISGLADLARDDVVFVTEEDSVPAGKYAAKALANAGVTARPVSKELDVKAAVAKVTGGEADATIVYVTDVKAAGAKGAGVDIPDAQNVIAEYPIAVVKATGNRAAAAAFVDAMVHGEGRRALQAHGFMEAS
jgi:molybdate transport system substrate-binding protein